ncbi:MAG: hypothetical protein ACYTGH_15995 [Planctomycetota bacterium]|jgi:hypothetical protein
MYSYTKQPRRRRTRGTAITETLLVAVPIWTFFFLCMQVLQFWERDHLDASVEMNNEFARQTITGLWFDEGAEADTTDPGYKGVFTFYSEKVEESSRPGTADDIDPALPKYYFYLTDQRGRKVMIYRGTNTWVPFLWLRGQHWGAEEDDRRREWFEKIGNETLEENRKALQLGS